MKKTALVIMAAGIGSRFGKGIKQLAPVGPKGEIIMDYSIHDALEAGFNKVVFIIRKDLEDEFKKVIGDRISKITEVAYAFQEIDDLPGDLQNRQTVPNHGEPDTLCWQQRKSFPSHSLLSMQMTTMEKKPT